MASFFTGNIVAISGSFRSRANPVAVTMTTGSFRYETADLRRRFPGFALNQTWPVRATLVYSVGTGSYRGQWSPAFIEGLFPIKERTQTLTREIRF